MKYYKRDLILMKNVNQLERQRKEVLLGMKEEEIKKLFENLSEELVSYHWSYKNNFSGNPEGIEKIKNRFLELDSDLKGRYKTDVLYFSSMYKTLAKEFDETNTEILRLQIKNDLLEFLQYANLFEHELFILKMVLDNFYIRYEFKYAFGNSYKLVDYIEEKFNLDINKEEDLEVIIDLSDKSSEIDKEYNEEKFRRVSRDHNFLIETLVESLEESLKKMNLFLEMDYEIENTIEELVPIVKSFIELQGIAKSLIDKYEDVKINPFKESIEVSVNVKMKDNDRRIKYNESLKEEDKIYSLPLYDYDEELAKAIANAPKYDFEEFRLIENGKEEGVEKVEKS